VGWLLRKLNHEQFREVFALGWSKDLPKKEQPLGIDLGVYRVYCITCNGLRFMEITEHYPIDLYA
jgi:chorismate-pyruvate lyase